MPFITARLVNNNGTATWMTNPSTYCQHNISASDYGKCYNIITGKAVFVQTNTATYPTLPCESDGTCIRYTSTTYSRTLSTIFSYTGKQAVLQYFYARSHASGRIAGNVQYLFFLPVPVPYNVEPAYLWFMPAPNYELASWPVYDPVANFKVYLNPYTIAAGYVNILRWHGSVFTSSASVQVYEGDINNIWYAFDLMVAWAYESSPLAVIPLDYDRDYLQYQELRGTFGYATTGIDQPGWNMDDIINVLRELFPDRAWAVFDDRTYTLFLYNLTPDYVPDWLVDKLNPTAMKVLMSPSDSSIARAWMDELNRRNAYNTPPPEVV